MNRNSSPVSAIGLWVSASNTISMSLFMLISMYQSPNSLFIGTLMSLIGNPSPLKIKVFFFLIFFILINPDDCNNRHFFMKCYDHSQVYPADRPASDCMFPALIFHFKDVFFVFVATVFKKP